MAIISLYMLQNWHTDAGILLSLLVAMVLSAVIGWDRERAGHSAGLRTNMLIGMSAALFTQSGDLLIEHFNRYAHVQGDPIRVLQSVVLGVSFLGSGVIFVSHNKDEVHGLTTAATVWTVTAIGIVTGLHQYLLAIGITAMVFLVLEVVRMLEVRFGDKPRQRGGS